MRAAIIEKYGPPNVLHTADIAPPEVTGRRVLIRVHAAGVNPIDGRIRSGSLRFLLPAQFPLVLGFDVSGVVEQMGADVSAFNMGDEVFCFLDNRHGAGYAEFAVASEQVVARKPSTVSHIEAAAAPLAGCTALQAFRDLGGIARGMKVLINGAAGGVGSIAVQVAKSFDTHVTGVCSTNNAEFVKELGADQVIDYSREDFTRRNERFHIVFDVVGKSSFWSCRSILENDGRYITTLPSASNFLALAWTPVFSRRRCSMVLARPNRDRLNHLKQLIEEGKLRLHVQHTFSLDEAASAHRMSEQHHVRGKLVLQIR